MSDHRHVWRRPRKEPLVDVDRALRITVHHLAAVRTAIRPYPQRHVFFALADMARPGRIAFIDNMQCFPKAQTLVDQHLHKAVEPPVIIHHAVADLTLAPLFGGFFLMLLDDHLPLGKIADHHSPFSQSVRDEMGGFMQTVLLFVALAFRYPLVDFGEMDIPAGMLFAAVPLRANFIQLLVVPSVTFEPADVVEAPLVVDASRERLDAQFESHDAVAAYGERLPLFPILAGLVLIVFGVLLSIVKYKRAVVVPSCIPGDGYFAKVLGRRFSEMRDDIGIAFGSPIPPASCG